MAYDAHARPPDTLRGLFKRWQKASAREIDSSDDILDLRRSEERMNQHALQNACISDVHCSQIFKQFVNEHDLHSLHCTADIDSSPMVHEVRSLPGKANIHRGTISTNSSGLFIYPSLLPLGVQVALLNRLIHRDLSNPDHKSNLHLHYDLPYNSYSTISNNTSHDMSFFRVDLTASLRPKDPSVHKTLTVKQMLERKLRWMTLGGQYNWTTKVYPEEIPPEFPQDIAQLLKGLFPNVDAQAAIVNFYTPGDTLSVHRDVSEECDRGLISISIGCDGLFIIGNADGSQSATIRLRSGDVVLMSGYSRYAWHAVPKILPGTCPDRLREWPASTDNSDFEAWKGWIANKRINLNVRQMRN